MDAFTHRRFYTQMLCAQAILHTEALTHKGLTRRRFYTQMLLDTEDWFYFNF